MADSDAAVSLRQFAAMQGWNPGHAHRLKVAGRLVMVTGESGRELVHVERSLQRIAESSDPQKGYMTEVNARQRAHRGAASTSRQPPAAPLPADGESSGQQNRNATYNQARTAREVYEAKLAQLRYEQEVGKLVDVERVRAEFGKRVMTVRDQFLRMPERLAPLLVGQGDMDTVKRTLDAEIRAVLSHFAEAN